MPDYRPVHVPRGTYFFTVNTHRRQTFLTDAGVRSVLREPIGRLRLTHLFVLGAWVFKFSWICETGVAAGKLREQHRITQRR